MAGTGGPALTGCPDSKSVRAVRAVMAAALIELVVVVVMAAVPAVVSHMVSAVGDGPGVRADTVGNILVVVDGMEIGGK
jgi:hypothetical protein